MAGDFTPEEYLGLQRVVHRVAEAVREEVGAEREYILSLGSNQGKAHDRSRAPLTRSSSSPP